jgi:hypothetical protein
MKTRLIFSVLFGVPILIACAQNTTPVSIETVAPSLTSTPVLQTSTPTVEWAIYATPLNLSYDTDNDEIISIIDNVFPGNCIKDRKNLLKANPTPIEYAAQVSPLTFIEASSLPAPIPNYYNERADNIDGSRTAFAVIVECQPRKCSKIYVTDNTIKRSYEIKMGGWSGPFGHLHWINRDTVTIVQEGHFMSLVVAINVDKQEFEYYGNISGCPMPTPTP